MVALDAEQRAAGERLARLVGQHAGVGRDADGVAARLDAVADGLGGVVARANGTTLSVPMRTLPPSASVTRSDPRRRARASSVPRVAYKQQAGA